MQVITHVALMLDALPAVGRLMLTAVLLALGLVAGDRLLQRRRDALLMLMYRKGALPAMVLLPLLVYLFGFEVSVPVSRMRSLGVIWPVYLSAGLGLVWGAGMAVHLAYLLMDLTADDDAALQVAPQSIQQRCEHWCQRLNIVRPVRVVLRGADQPWHRLCRDRDRDRDRGGDRVWGEVWSVQLGLPAAAANWPRGVVDVALLTQLAPVKQRAWWWLLVARVIAAVFWWLPWVSRVAAALAGQLVPAAHNLARSAYRDPDGWRRDVRQAQLRCETLDSTPVFARGHGLRLQMDHELAGLGEDASHGQYQAVTSAESLPPLAGHEAAQGAMMGAPDVAQKWQATRARRRAKYRDPYEQAYWWIAMVATFACTVSAMTLTQAPPEFEPRYLNVRWQEQMTRRIHDDIGAPSIPQDEGSVDDQQVD